MDGITMLTGEEIDEWDTNPEKKVKEWIDNVDKSKEIKDLFAMYCWSSETLPYGELIRMLKDQSTTTASTYQVSLVVQYLSGAKPSAFTSITERENDD
ncbi:MAG: hypothetical protein HOM41_02545 [Flavobacteriales bacterium]|jgi:hypothetical protein|nr:hypothetical protein [Flavobacteriales bacterium]